MKTISVCWKTLVRKWRPAEWRSVCTCTPGRGHPSRNIKSSYVSVSAYSSRNLAKYLDKHITKDCYPCYQNIWKGANVFAMGGKQIKTMVIGSTPRPSSREAWRMRGATGAPKLLAGMQTTTATWENGMAASPAAEKYTLGVTQHTAKCWVCWPHGSLEPG